MVQRIIQGTHTVSSKTTALTWQVCLGVAEKCYEKFHRNRGAESQGDTQSKYWEELKLMNRSPGGVTFV